MINYLLLVYCCSASNEFKLDKVLLLESVENNADVLYIEFDESKDKSDRESTEFEVPVVDCSVIFSEAVVVLLESVIFCKHSEKFEVFSEMLGIRDCISVNFA